MHRCVYETSTQGGPVRQMERERFTGLIAFCISGGGPIERYTRVAFLRRCTKSFGSDKMGEGKGRRVFVRMAGKCA